MMMKIRTFNQLSKLIINPVLQTGFSLSIGLKLKTNEIQFTNPPFEKGGYVFFLIILFFLSVKICTSSIKEEIHYGIGNVDFAYKGTEMIDNKLLLGIMQTPKNKWYNQEVLVLDMKRIKKYYFDNGFFNSLVDTAVTYDNSNETADITLIITEKNRYVVNNVKFNGLETISNDVASAINKDKAIVAGEFYNRVQILQEENRIVDILHNNGYLYAGVDSASGTVVMKYSSADSNYNDKVNLEINFVNANKIYHVGDTKVEISKNIYNIEDRIILRELVYKQGDLYSKENITQSERNFAKLGILQTARIQIDTVFEEQRKINYVIRATLNNRYEITPNIKGVSIEGAFYLGAGVLYVDRNFFKGGRVFTIEVNGLAHSNVDYRADVNLALFQPYLYNYNITGTLNSKFNIINRTELQSASIENLVRINYFIAPYTFYQNVYADFTVDLLRLRYKVDAVVDNETIKAGTVTNLLNSVMGFTLVHDNTNDVFQPSKGFYNSISLENAGLIPRLISLINPNLQYSQYVKFYIPSRFYFDISGGKGVTIFATKFIIGDILEYGGGENIEPVASIYKFFSGGSTSLRGWNARESGMLENPKLGGKFLLEGSGEYRWKLFYNSQGLIKNLWLVPFFDYGNVWNSAGLFRLNEIAMDIGFGIRYESFAGPLRFDFAFKLYDPIASPGKKWLFDRGAVIFKEKFAIQFGIGNAF